jgi:hypothetical protein
MHRYFLTLVILLSPRVLLSATDLPPGATLLDGEYFCWEKWKEPTIAVSPDGITIAYVNKGAIWECQVDGDGPSKLAELKGTIDEFLAKTEFGDARGQEWKVRKKLGNGPFNQITVDMSKVDGMQWRRSGKAIVYALADHAQSGIHAARYQIMEASRTSEVHPIVTIDRDIGEEPHALTAFHVRADNKFLVATGPFPLIWDVEANKPVATPFDYLLPSVTSDRYLGIEIDTRQLVLVDEGFKVIKRYNATFEPQRNWDLIWSPDERFAICRTYSNQSLDDSWTGFRIDLKTGAKRALDGYKGDRFLFVGHSGVMIRIGMRNPKQLEYGDGRNGSYIALVPEGNEPQRDIFRFDKPRKVTDEWNAVMTYPLICASSDCDLFAMALPRDSGKPGYLYHLIDRSGRKWPFPDDPSLLVAPYRVLAFVDEDKKLVARDDTRLFSIPVATIKAAAEERK